ncbi:NAC domain-containing protein 35-like isoform X1 [Phoenix dactylifera]|uniref:NAC domain-containing protein 35-like isoform X1 n=1 Tax=Phoenix dactylifera TaxID=42345 RepID=A0A8B8JA36_PHODC|nr:NAC domain-containing protein 35-like isoform X1 [Phoenix dactylifera]XP_026664392.1 NAC domain-containing protein 35-like isoform X1 [Phoenix dactylifera]
MAITAAMSADDGRDAHEDDLVMPGFRFHPTEEELIEFYLRRKVEGKRFNVELITFLDLYRYDPWELPALAAIGEKEWFFYVPRDRKYRNGDRPNRVTTSGYWKATGADRMIRAENHRSIGLKKTLVFYTGKAPKGIRTSWIMNEYRLPHSETDRHQKAEISLCRVYKRAGVDDRCQLPGTLSSKASSSRGTGPDKKHGSSHQPPPSFQTFAGDSSSSVMEKAPKIGGEGSTHLSAPVLQKPALYRSTASVASLGSTTSTEEDGTSLHYPKNTTALISTCSVLTPATSCMASPTIDELHSLVGYNQNYLNQPYQSLPSQLQPQLLPLNALPVSFPTISDKLWEWNPLHEVGRDFASFK